MKDKDGLHQWGSIFTPRNKAGALDTWRKLAPWETLDKLIKELNEGSDAIGSRESKDAGAICDKRLTLDERKALQAFDVHAFVCSKREKLLEDRGDGELCREKAIKALELFRMERYSVDKREASDRGAIEASLTRTSFTMDYAQDSSESLRSIVDSVGQRAAASLPIFQAPTKALFVNPNLSNSPQKRREAQKSITLFR